MAISKFEKCVKYAVKAIEVDISDRRGLRHEWDQIDSDIKRQIRKAWAADISAAFAIFKEPSDGT